ncbi:MAG: group II truncated hemoglobin [Burkholderiales bacterium]
MQPDRRAPPYERIGGADGVRRLVRRFYELMDESPQAQAVRNLHGESLAGSEEKLYKFLSGWLGGPQLFIEEYGHPALRRRHMPFSIGDTERDQWMVCMNEALSETVDDDNLRLELSTALSKVADHMRNRAQDQNLS